MKVLSMNIDSVAYRLDALVSGEPRLEALLAELMPALKARHRFNIEAHLPYRTVDLHTRDISEYTHGEDYEVGSRYENERDDPDILPSYDAVEERIEELTDLRENARTKKMQAALDEIIEGWENAKGDPKYDEIIMNRIYRPYDDPINEDLAHDLGFGVITFNNDNDSNLTYIGFQGGGQDMTPDLMAYIAIEHQVVDPEHAHYLYRSDDFQWARYVVGDTMLIKVLHSLKVLEAAIRCGIGKDRRKLSGPDQDRFEKKAKAFAKKNGILIPRLKKDDPAAIWIKEHCK